MPNLIKQKKILVFGVFDGVHDGHLSFIKEARSQGDQLIAVVARDLSVEKLKGKIPKYNEVDRIKKLLEVSEIDLVLLGDPQTGTYNVLKEVNPDIIFLGYNQDSLYDDLDKKIKDGYFNNKDIKILRGIPFNPEIFNSSYIDNKK